MAGMLPGVETARRRRLRGSDPSSVVGSGFGSSRIRFSHDTHLPPTWFLQRSQLDEDEKLGGAAREAKERLDGRLRGHLKQEIKRSVNGLCRKKSEETLRRRLNAAPMGAEELQMSVFGSNRKGLKTLRWGKKWLRWKSSEEEEEDECAICLDQFKAGEKVAHLRCLHRFHSECLLPWLESNAHCPCCRANVYAST